MKSSNVSSLGWNLLNSFIPMMKWDNSGMKSIWIIPTNFFQLIDIQQVGRVAQILRVGDPTNISILISLIIGESFKIYEQKLQFT